MCLHCCTRLIINCLFLPFETFGHINNLNCVLSFDTFISSKKWSTFPVNPAITGDKDIFEIILLMQLSPFHVFFHHILYYLKSNGKSSNCTFFALITKVFKCTLARKYVTSFVYSFCCSFIALKTTCSGLNQLNRWLLCVQVIRENA